MARSVTLKGTPLTLTGPELKVGDKAPDAVLRKDLMTDVRISETGGKPRIFSVVPSLDTPVRDADQAGFNEEIAKLPNVDVYTISNDLPTAQKRFCSAEGMCDRIKTLSDYMECDFGKHYGTLVPTARIQCRAVFVVDSAGVLRYVEYVPEIADHPNYDKVLEAARSAS